MGEKETREVPQMRNRCPICEDQDVFYAHGPYVECMTCSFWYQIEPGEKLYEGSHEKPGDQMSQHEKDVNYLMAKELYERFLKGRESACALDIGAKFPWLMHCINKISGGTTETWAIDGVKEIEAFCKGYDLSVKGFWCDFELTNYVNGSWPWGNREFDLICMVHMIEHLYSPIESLNKVRHLMKPDGKFFIRCPSSDVKGIERDFTEVHYSIHPQIWNKKSLEYMAKKVGFEILIENEVQPGQRDLILGIGGSN